ncbi:MAG TPA: aminodeoxychorismate synthase component I [Acidimicrobiales bacterium]|nr:aminodeoxychorismate synthase component I [Acidimicrobiales bacterium]
MVFSARFDDLSGAGRAWQFVDPLGEIVATRAEDVRGALDAVETASRAGRWLAGFVTYEAAAGLDPALRVHEGDDDLPLLWFGVFGDRRAVDTVAAPDSDPPGAWTMPDAEASHAAAVALIHEQIAAGNTYQVNLGLHLHASAGVDPARLYRQLCHAQRSAYGALLDTGEVTIASASPELFFSLEGSRLTTRPMKGTAPRGRWPSEDRRRRDELLASPKDRAENLMIVDLLRNDMGRVAEWGSVHVESLFDIERYETVWQLTSTISAHVRAGTSLTDVFAALFPCGSVTGAPKVRTMEIISELEPSPRGVFCGAIGVVGPARHARFAVGIRTATFVRGDASYGVGSGITWASRPADEFQELRDKTQVLSATRPDFALLETMRHEPGGGLHHGELHLGRMAESAEHFGFTFDRERVALALKDALAGITRASRVRLQLHRDGTPLVTLGELPPADTSPVRLVVDPCPTDSRNVFVFHKTTNRRHLERRSEHALLVNERGELTESPIANVALHVDGRWWTPPIESGCLPGIERQQLIAEERLAERILTVADARRADELALISSLRGWRPATLS